MIQDVAKKKEHVKSRIKNQEDLAVMWEEALAEGRTGGLTCGS